MPIAAGGRPQPTLRLELGLSALPLDPLSSVIWTDITPWLLEISTFTGRTHELNRAEPGTGTLRLNNRDRRFDPTNTASPYAPYLVPMRRLRWTAEWAGVRYPLWCGYVRTFQPSWPSATSSETTVPIADALYVLNLWPIVSAAYHDAVMADGPARYYRLGEIPGSAVAVDSSGNGANGTYSNNPNLGASPGLITDLDTAVDFSPSGSKVDCPLLPTFPTGAATFELLLKSTSDTPGMALEADNGTAGYQIDLESLGGDGTLTAVFLGPGGGIAVLGSAIKINDGNWHHVLWCRNSFGIDNRLYVDGVLRDAVPTGFVPMPTGMSLGIARTGGHAGNWSGSIDEVAIYTYELSDDRIAAHYNAALGLWGAQFSGQRINAVLDAVGWPSADRDIDAGAQMLPPVRTPFGTTKAFEHMAAVSDSEAGLLFVSPAGLLTLHDRHRTLKPPYLTSLATFGDGAGELHYDSGGLEVSPDETDLWTEAMAQREGGNPQIVVDAANAAQYGHRRLETTGLLTTSDADAWDRANWDLQHYSTPTQRVRAIHIKPMTGDAVSLWPQVLSRAIHDRITAKARPVGGGPPFSQDCLIEGIAHHYVAGESWETVFSTSVAESQSYWLLGTSALGSDTRLAY